MASEAEFVPWQSISIGCPDLPIVGVIKIEVSTQNLAYQKFEVTAFGQVHRLSDADLKRLQGYPLSSLRLTQEVGYAQLGGHSVDLKFGYAFYDETKRLMNTAIDISVYKGAPLRVTEDKRPAADG